MLLTLHPTIKLLGKQEFTLRWEQRLKETKTSKLDIPGSILNGSWAHNTSEDIFKGITNRERKRANRSLSCVLPNIMVRGYGRGNRFSRKILLTALSLSNKGISPRH